MNRLSALVAVLAGICGGVSAAAELRALAVDRDDGTYRVNFEAVVDAPIDATFAVLSDYSRRLRLSDAVLEATVTPLAEPDAAQVRTVAESCVMFFCRRIVQVQNIVKGPGYRVRAAMVPSLSDFSSGHSEWSLQAEGERTAVRYQAEKTPSFWIPPLIGPWAVERALRRDLEASIVNLEAQARAEATLAEQP